MKLYKGQPKHYVAVDCVILGYQDEEIKLLLYPRSFEPLKGEWSLLGGFMQDEETSEQAAGRVLKQTTGLEKIYMEQVAAFTQPDREKDARVISIAYYALIRIDLHDEKCVKENGASWFSINNLPELILDHQGMAESALFMLRQKASYSLVGLELLPEMFTIMQLRKLYEAIFQREFDPGNFRKKILSLNSLKRSDIKDSTESKKGAYYYSYCETDAPDKDIDRLFKINTIR